MPALWAATLVVLLSGFFVFASRLVLALGRAIGWTLRRRTQSRRELLVARAETERAQHEEQGKGVSSADDDWEKVEKSRIPGGTEAKAADPTGKDWNGVVGFFHPFCNAGGGGERVLWAAIRVTQQRWPKALCVVYTGDHDASKLEILKRAEERFGIKVYAPSVAFVYLSTRQYVLASTWPKFTLLGQSIGSIGVAYDAFSLLVPDIFIDTMGYAFALGLSKFLFPNVPTAAYVHYPTISTDMLGSLDAETRDGKGLHAGLGKGVRGQLKRKYWQLFAQVYSWMGGSIDVVMTNSSWTQDHIRKLWTKSRSKQGRPYPVDVVFPPTAVEELEAKVDVSLDSEKRREPLMVYVAQFRPEKNHQLIIKAFAELLKDKSKLPPSAQDPRLLLIGSVRDSADETFIYSLRLLAHELHVTESVQFILNASWATILEHLQTASIGINGMWNEHFGIGVVEYQAAGLISVVNNSGGPKWDIVIDQGDGPTGYHASTETEYAQSYAAALSLDHNEAYTMRQRARASAKRFNEASFEERWLAQMERLIELQVSKASKGLGPGLRA